MAPGLLIIRVILVFFFFLSGGMKAAALDSISLLPEVKALDITDLVEHHGSVGDRIQVSIAPGMDGLVRRILVHAQESGGNSYWAVFALANRSEEALERLLVSDYYHFPGSGMVWPDLGVSRIASITPSQGPPPRPLSYWGADVFVISLNPGEVITFVLELRADNLPHLYLWEKDAYENKLNGLAFFHGLLAGISGLLALLLTLAFVVRWSLFFPAAALFSWSVFAYFCVEFGLLDRVFGISGSGNPFYRAGAEIMMPVTLLIFIFTFLKLRYWHVYFVYVVFFWLFCLLMLLGVALYQPPIAAGLARFSFAFLGVIVFLLLLFLGFKRCDRAIVLIPAWSLFLLWLFGAGAAIAGRWEGDLVFLAIMSGLVVVVLVMTVTVVQYAFSGGVAILTKETDAGRKALALSGCGVSVWDWSIVQKRVFTGAEFSTSLGYDPESLSCSIKKWLSHVYLADRSVLEVTLRTAVEQRGGCVDTKFRILRSDGRIAWVHLKARPVIGSEGKIVRCIGTLNDITVARVAQERLMHDAIYDNLTGLPNRPLFLDRLGMIMKLSYTGKLRHPAVLLFAFHDLKEVGGQLVSDSILLTMTYRLSRIIDQCDTLGRLSGNRLAVILISASDPKRIASFAREAKEALKVPIMLHGQEVSLVPLIGLSLYKHSHKDADALLSEAEIAMRHTSKLETDRIGIFDPVMIADKMEYGPLGSELNHAITSDEFEFLYQPVMTLSDPVPVIAGFEVMVRWNHPRLGPLNSDEFVEFFDEDEKISEFFLYVVNHAAIQLRNWQALLRDRCELFMSIKLFSERLLRYEVVNDLKQIFLHTGIFPRSLKIEISESVLMLNMELAARIIRDLRNLESGVILDTFGTRYLALECLESCPFEMIRVSKPFVSVNGVGKRSVILGSIIEMMRDLGIFVLVSGLDCPEDVYDLGEMGCKFGQGYVFGKPVPAKEVKKKLTGSLIRPGF
ncbi:MAG: EAL domain-containing protein [Alphaproteobacteria bacterium]|nr:EAL domain-containing protein [Alphaproteobacteria bacterium]